MVHFPLCASAASPLGDRHRLRLVSFSQGLGHGGTYIGVRRQRLFVLTSPPLRLGSSLRGGVASRRALALLGGLAVSRRGRLALGETREDKGEGANTQTEASDRDR